MSNQKKVVFKIRPSSNKQHFTDITIGAEITHVSETYTDQRNAVKTSRSIIRKIQAGLVEIALCNEQGVPLKYFKP